MRICVVGLGTIGTATLKYIHEKGLPVFGFDPAKKSIENEEIYTNWEQAPKPDVYVVTVPSESVEGVCRTIAEREKDCCVSVESTVPVGTCRKISESHNLKTLVHCPHRYWAENPVQCGIKQLRVLGAVNEPSLEWGSAFYRTLGVPIQVCSTVETAEMCKIAENACRFVQIAFAEELRRICECTDISFDEVRVAANTHFNVQILEARDGINGCLAKDVRHLRNMSPDTQLMKGAIFADNSYKKRTKKFERKIL